MKENSLSSFKPMRTIMCRTLFLLLLVSFALLPARLYATDLSASKEANNQRVIVGDTLQFIIVVYNTSTVGGGPFDSPDTIMQDLLDNAFAPVTATASNGGSCTISGQLVRCMLGTVPANSTVAITITVVAQLEGRYTNIATVEGGLFDPNANNNVSPVVEVEILSDANEADVAVEKMVDKTTTNPGQVLTYTIKVTNHGPQDAQGVRMTDLLPTSLLGDLALQIISFDPADKCSLAGDTLTCNLGAMAAGASETITLVASVLFFDNLYNVVSVTSSAPGDPNLDNNTSEARTMVVPGKPRTNANNPETESTDDPISTFTGELFFRTSTDLALNGPFPLFFSRYYASFLARDGFADSALGPNWTHSFDWRLIRLDTTLIIVTPEGLVILFDREGSAWQQTNALHTQYQIVEAGTTFRFADPRTQRIYTFDASGKLTTIEDGHGNAHTLHYAEDRLVEVADGLGRVLTLTYNGGGHLTIVADGSRSVGFDYTNDLLTRATNALGDHTTYRYNDAGAFLGLLTARILPGGNTVNAQTYDAEGRASTQTDALGNTLTLTYQGSETTVTDALGNAFKHTYSPEGHLIGYTDEAGQGVQLAYDEAGRRNQIIDRLGAQTTFAFDATTGLPTATTEANGATVSYTYTPRQASALTFYDLTQVGLPDGTSVRFTYDANGNPTTVSAGSDTWTYTYNNRGQVLTATNPAGGVTTYSYTANGTLASIQDPAGGVITLSYDAVFRLVGLTYPDGSTRSYSYDAVGQLLSFTNERGQTHQFTYDGNGNPITWTDAAGHTTQYTYDTRDRLVEIINRTSGISRLTYDALGQLTTATDPNGNTVQMGYDARRRLIALTDGENQQWQMNYDAEDILTAFSNPVGDRWTFSSNAMGWVEQGISPGANASHRTFDALGRVTVTTNPLGQSTTYSHDTRGLRALALPGGAFASYSRDGLGVITQVVDPGGQTWSYDRDALGRLAATTDPLGRTTAYTYDSRHRVAQVNLPAPLGMASLSYDATGNLTGISYTDGTTLTYLYDTNNLLIAASNATLSRDAEGRLTESNGLILERDAAGRITRVLLPGGDVHYEYDRSDRVTAVTDWQGRTTTLSYDAAGRLVSLARPNNVTTTYQYDANSRMTHLHEDLDTGTSSAASLATIQLERDATGRVTAATYATPMKPDPTKGTQTWRFDAASQIESAQYDARGRLVQHDTSAYTWNGASHLMAYTSGDKTHHFTYDAFGQVLTREADGTTRSYVWNYAFDLPSIAVERENDDDRFYYLHTPDGSLLYRIDAESNAAHYYHYDEAGNTLFLTDETGAITAAYAYSPYGDLLSTSGGEDNPFTYQGRYGVMRVGETGLYYARARYYDSRTGRFLSSDPIRSFRPRQLNGYQYAFGNPIGFADRNGLTPEPSENKAPGEPSLGEQATNAVKNVISLGPSAISGGLTTGAAGLDLFARSQTFPFTGNPAIDFNAQANARADAAGARTVGKALSFLGAGIAGIQEGVQSEDVGRGLGVAVADFGLGATHPVIAIGGVVSDGVDFTTGSLFDFKLGLKEPVTNAGRLAGAFVSDITKSIYNGDLQFSSISQLADDVDRQRGLTTRAIRFLSEPLIDPLVEYFYEPQSTRKTPRKFK